MAVLFVELKGSELGKGETYREPSMVRNDHVAPTIKYDTTPTWFDLTVSPKGTNALVVSNTGVEAVAVAILDTPETDPDQYHVIMPGAQRMLETSNARIIKVKTA